MLKSQVCNIHVHVVWKLTLDNERHCNRDLSKVVLSHDRELSRIRHGDVTDSQGRDVDVRFVARGRRDVIARRFASDGQRIVLPFDLNKTKFANLRKNNKIYN